MPGGQRPLPIGTRVRNLRLMVMPRSPQSNQPAWAGVVTIVQDLRGGRPVIRGMRIAVDDVLGRLASGMSEAEILAGSPELTGAGIRTAPAFAAEREASRSPSETWAWRR